MQPKEKARELVNRFFKAEHQPFGYKDAVMCALIVVDEILLYIDSEFQGFLDTDKISWWNQVKQEIQKL